MAMDRRVAALVLLALSASAHRAFGAGLSVDMKNDAAKAVSVRIGSDNGVTPASDYEVVVAEGQAVRIYPVEIYTDRFWSQPLSPHDFSAVKDGMPVRPAALDRAAHEAVRAEGEARRREIRAREEDARRAVQRQKLDDLRQQRDRLIERRDALDDRLARSEADLSDEEGRSDWLQSGYDDDIDRSLQRIGEMADRRDELQSQRDVLSRQKPYPRNEIDRLSAEIRSLNGQIDSERSSIRTARERKRSARSSYLSRKQEWQRLVSERNAAQAEVRQVEQKIRDLSAQLGSRGGRE